MFEFDFLVVGGGAAGYFAAINAIHNFPYIKVAILEKNREVLQKVKVSGGGRCNVTNGCTIPEELVRNYPRGHEFLLEPFKNFGSREVFEWFELRGFKLKTEKDHRVFPITDSSQTIIDCLQQESKKVKLFTSERVENIEKKGSFWQVSTSTGKQFVAKNILLSTGSDKRIWEILHQMDFKIAPQAPSLFTFNINDLRLNELQGVSFADCSVKISKTSFSQSGPMLITHWGISGPAVLKLSSWAALELMAKEYQFQIEINFVPDWDKDQIISEFRLNIDTNPKKTVMANPLFGLTARFWKYICEKSAINDHHKWAETGKKHFQVLLENLQSAKYEVHGKSTFKEEFVTAGGIDLSEIDHKTFGSRRFENLYFAGEILNIDALTGGFNFQAAWTGAWHVAKSLSF
jgi:predicted Rossmann fold flavoprotein